MIHFRQYALSLVLLINPICAMQVDPRAVRSEHLGNVALFYDNDGFTVDEDGVEKRVQKYDVDKLFQNKTPEEIAALAAIAKFKVSKFNNGEYAIRAHGDINGGGPVTAAALYWTVKSLCWFGVGAGAAVVGTGVAAATAATGGAVLGAAGGAAGTVATLAIGSTAGTMGTVAAGAVAGGAVVSTAAATTAATTATVVGASLGAPTVVAATIVGIESASLGAAAFGLALPLP